MSADPDIICAPAPAPAPAHQESAAKTMIIDRAEIGMSKLKVFAVVLLFALAAGAAVTFVAMRVRGAPASVSATSETVTGGEEPAEAVAPAKDSGEAPAECVGEIADPQLRWYCTQFLPFAKKASADHDRLDRLEAAGRNSGNSGVPLGLWLVVIGIGLLTVYNTVKVHSSPRGKPSDG